MILFVICNSLTSLRVRIGLTLSLPHFFCIATVVTFSLFGLIFPLPRFHNLKKLSISLSGITVRLSRFWCKSLSSLIKFLFPFHCMPSDHFKMWTNHRCVLIFSKHSIREPVRKKEWFSHPDHKVITYKLQPYGGDNLFNSIHMIHSHSNSTESGNTLLMCLLEHIHTFMSANCLLMCSAEVTN